jgi:hypothetical protein
MDAGAIYDTSQSKCRRNLNDSDNASHVLDLKKQSSDGFILGGAEFYRAMPEDAIGVADSCRQRVTHPDIYNPSVGAFVYSTYISDSHREICWIFVG